MTTYKEPIGFVASLVVDPDADTFSVLGGLRQLWSDGDHFLACLIMVFSIVFPAIKILLILKTFHAKLNNGIHSGSRTVFRYLSMLGKWSMLDVFVLALLVVLVKRFSTEDMQIELRLRWGAYSFAISIVAGMFLTIWTRKLLIAEFKAARHENGV